MIKMSENKKDQSISDVVRPKDDSVGEMLRTARLSKNQTIEEVSTALRIRHVQLRAIEENNIDALPGITYAVGFVRSYANYVGLNGAEVVHKFKAEQGHASAQSKLDFPEPVAESRMPDPLMVGAGALLAALVLVLWVIYSSMNGSVGKEAEQIQPAPAEAVSEVTAEVQPEAQPAQPETPPATTAAEAAPAAAPVVEPAPALPPAPGEATTSTAPVQPETAAVPAPVATPASAPAVAEAPVAPAPAVEKKAEAGDDSVIKIKHGKSRITLQANQPSWVQITDSKGDVVYKKVLRPGDTYYVPDQDGLSLVTSNAGGLKISVDGKAVQAIGKSGEILRGVDLNPADMKKTRTRISD
jgi:cytoskeleton protein RodZ